MATRGGQPGNDNGAKNKIWSEALRKHITQNPKDLIASARALLAKCKDGDVAAIKELGDRLEGKPHQSIAADVNMKTVIIEASKEDEGL